jgi:hypothetical protein
MRRVLPVMLFVTVVLTALVRVPTLVAADVPARLTDQEFWKLVTDLSEPNGSFRSDNLLSNEVWFQRSLPQLARMTRPGGAYIGVGPEQNFTYVVALKPAIAFIVDVRRGNLDLQLMYKALFELSTDRADFVSRLFSRRRPATLTAASTPTQIFNAISAVTPTEDVYVANLSNIRNLLMTTHRFGLSADDLGGIEYVYRAFYTMGPEIRYAPFGISGGTIQPTYAELMTAMDDMGIERGFLSSDATFSLMRDFQRRNLLVPIVGNFSGPKAIRAVGRYLKERNAPVSAFYLSNVEEYLLQDGTWNAFCANVAALPLDETSTFIRSVRTNGPSGLGEGFTSELRPIAAEVRNCSSSPRP